MFVAGLAFLLYFASTNALDTCTELHNLKPVQQSTKLAVSPFLKLNRTSVVQCGRECLLRTRCLSFNFDLRFGQCQLLNTTSDQTASSLVTTEDSVHSDKASWPRTLAGKCAEHVCPGNTVCKETGSNYTCVVTHCVGPPSVNHGVLKKAADRVFWGIGETLDYICDAQYFPRDQRVCQANGSWSDFTCSPITDCSRVQSCNMTYGDGEYWILLGKADRANVKIYCHDMATDSPISYISLVEDNHSIYPGTCWKGCSKTVYQKVGFSMGKISLKLVDTTFATSSAECDPFNFGIVSGCSETETCQDFGTLRIDLRGTGFSIDTNITWGGLDGGEASVTASGDWTQVNVTCLREMCTKCYPLDNLGNRIYFLPVSINDDDSPPIDSATVPVCN